jgi:hypothetical protein
MASKRPVTCHIIGQMKGELPKFLLIYAVMQTCLTINDGRFRIGLRNCILRLKKGIVLYLQRWIKTTISGGFG